MTSSVDVFLLPQDHILPKGSAGGLGRRARAFRKIQDILERVDAPHALREQVAFCMPSSIGSKITCHVPESMADEFARLLGNYNNVQIQDDGVAANQAAAPSGYRERMESKEKALPSTGRVFDLLQGAQALFESAGGGSARSKWKLARGIVQTGKRAYDIGASGIKAKRPDDDSD